MVSRFLSILKVQFLKVGYLILGFLGLVGCQINFDADLYSSDLISLGNHSQEQSISLPMTIEFQVASCDDLSTQNRIFSTYFSEYEFLGCDVNNEDFMSYVEAQVSTSVTNRTQISDLIGFQVEKSDDGQYLYVYAALNEDSFLDLKEYIFNETFQELSLADSKFSVNFVNDSGDLTVWVQSSFVDRNPTVYQTDFEVKKRDKINIELSDVVKVHLEKNSWSPLLIISNE